jgi:hypothetical protein
MEFLTVLGTTDLMDSNAIHRLLTLSSSMSHHCYISASNSNPFDVPYYISFTSEEPYTEEPYTSGYNV